MKGDHLSRLIALLVGIIFMAVPGAGATATALSPELPAPPPIIGGDPVDEGEYPWMVGLRYVGDREPFCGGSILAPEWILTAAHCFFDGDVMDTFASDLEVIAGTVDLLGGGGVSARVASIHHPGYDGERNDVALLRLRAPLSFSSDRIAPIELSADPGYPPVGTWATIAGWGAIRADGSGAPRTLQQVDLPITRCDGGDDERSTICAGGVSGQDSCSGDSGGPLFVPDGDLWIQVGISSSGEDVCGLGSFYGLYTRVSHHAGWIERVLATGDDAVEEDPGAEIFFPGDTLDGELYARQLWFALALIGIFLLGIVLLGIFLHSRRRERSSGRETMPPI